MAKNPQGGASGHTPEQMLRTLVENVHELLERMSNELSLQEQKASR
jgi:hypothetical protein